MIETDRIEVDVKDSDSLAEADRRLIGALQISPRAPWAAVGEALGVSAVTVARRWQRLRDSGIAWVTAAPGIVRRAPQCIAYVELTCDPAHRVEVAHELAAHEQVATVELTTGTADMLLTVVTADFRTLSSYLLDRLGKTPHVSGTRARVATALYSEASSWRLVEFDDPTRRALESTLRTGESREEPPPTMSEELRAVARALAADGRASLAEIAEQAGMSPTSVRRHLATLIGSGTVLPRTDLAAELAGWPVQVYLWGDAPVDALARVARSLASIRQVRLCATVGAAPSLILSAWLTSIEEVHRLEMAVAQALPEVRIVDRLVVLRTVKRMGRLTDDDGRAVGVVPLEPWGRSDPL